MHSNLVIIGNGFDLACGLKTKYIHYFNYVKDNSLEFAKLINFLSSHKISDLDDFSIINELLKLLPKNQEMLTFWDVYFTFQDWVKGELNTDQTWTDIETMLLTSFDAKQHFDISCAIIGSAARKVLERDFDLLYDVENVYRYLGLYVYEIFKDRNMKLDSNAYNSYLELELDRFSQNFSKYINLQLAGCPDYNDKARYLISRIIGSSRMDDYMVDSFNYTPINYSNHHHNIHGLASREDVVFGITCGENAERKTIHNQRKYRFTKEFKIAKMLTKYGEHFNNYSYINHVFIFGSSLGGQDYDYFKTIFDECKLLSEEPKANVIFAYSIYKEDKRNEIIDDATTKVASLINTYGDRNGVFDLFRQLLQKGIIYIKKI